MQLHYGAGSNPAWVTRFFTLAAFSFRVKFLPFMYGP